MSWSAKLYIASNLANIIDAHKFKILNNKLATYLPGTDPGKIDGMASHSP